MPTRIKKRLVIDASVARAAGQESATFPASKHCRDFLKAVLTICHGILLPQTSSAEGSTRTERSIRGEWMRHASRFSRTWLNSMFGRKKVDTRKVPEQAPLRQALATWATDSGVREAVLKDAHLVEAALAVDRIVISCDDTARTHLSRAATHLPQFLSIAWVDPTKDASSGIQWLERNAPLEPSLLLTSCPRESGLRPGR